MGFLQLFARRDAEGNVLGQWLRDGAAGLELHDEADGSVWPVAPGLVFGAFSRYGRPVGEGVAVDGPHVAVEDGARRGHVVHFRHLAFGDVIANDFIALVEPSAPAVAVPAPLFSAALAALVRASLGRNP